jgi:hypothetical protein
VKVIAATLLLGLSLPAAALAQETVTEPRSGVSFPARRDGMTLLGVGVRTRTMLKVKVYAIGLYAADSALTGTLAAHKGKPASEALYKDLVWGDFPKQVVLKFTRGLGQDKIQEAMREALSGADAKLTNLFVSYFPEVKEGEECVLRWLPGGTLETTYAGLNKGPINDKNFAAAVFGIWLREKPIQEEIKRDLVARFK